ncbi:MAG: FAD-dependent monooxygenase [Vulcanimicrobiota bacterium]
MDTDILIVGAGPTGLLLAIELARRAIPHRLIDKAILRTQESQALGLHPRTLEVLENVGVIRDCLRDSVALKATSVYTPGCSPRRISLELASDSRIPYPEIRVLPQKRLESILTRRLEQLGGCVERGVAFQKGWVSDDLVTAVLSHQDGAVENLACRFLVGCDGPYSRVRASTGIGFPGHTEELVYTLGEASVDWALPHGESYQFVGATRYLLAIPLPQPNRFRLATWESAPPSRCPERVQHGPLVSSPCLEDFQAIVREVVPVPTRLSDAARLTSYRVGARLAQRFRQGPVFLAGDAAHILPPIGAQGMNLGLQDAFNLGWKLAAGAPEELLDSYEQERRPIAAVMLEQAGRALSSLDSWNEPRGWANLERLMLARRWSHLDANYRTSPAVCDLDMDLPEAAIRAGDRAPDGWLKEPATKGKVRLFELFREPIYHLLTFGDLEEVANRLRREFADQIKVHSLGQEPNQDTEALLSAYGFRGAGMVLIRPDGYVAFRGPASQAPELFRFLGSLQLGGEVAV